MSRTRAMKMAEIVKVEISDIITAKLKDPQVGFTTVTGVDVTNDLRYCKVFVSVLGSQEEQEQTYNALLKATGFVRTELGSRITVRHVPEIRFVLDQTAAHGAHISELLRQVKEQDKDDQ